VGDGVWVQTKFDLDAYLGQRVKIRWLGHGWDFGKEWNSYMEPPGGAPPFNIFSGDDGWWIDAIQLTGAQTEPSAPIVETGAIPMTNQCPAAPSAHCDESQGSSGFAVDFRLTDADGDGTVVQGESLVLDATQSANPGGCADGVPQFRFLKSYGTCTTATAPHVVGDRCVLDADCGTPGICASVVTTTIQDWSTAGSMRLGDTQDGDLYQVQVRCSSDFSCTTTPVGPPAAPTSSSAAGSSTSSRPH
jgi:hypothetical protein